MTSQELKRYDRQVLLPELGLTGQEKLKESAVLVIGAGGLGCPVLQYLTAAGIGKIGVVDDDLIEESNLQRQVLFNTADLGKSKAETAVEKLKLLNPFVALQAYNLRITSENCSIIIKEYDVVIDGSDNFPTRYVINDSCVLLKKPLVFGSIFKFEGQLSVFNYHGGPDYRAFFPEPPAAEEVPDCNEAGVIGTLPGIIGSYMANEAIKIIGGFGEVLSGKLFMISALNNISQLFNLSLPVTIQNNPPQDSGHPANAGQIHQENHIPLESDYGEASSAHKITPDELKRWAKESVSYCLIDIRETYEYEENNIGGIHISLYDLPSRIGELPLDKRIVLYCTSGTRSNIAFHLLKHKLQSEIYVLIF